METDLELVTRWVGLTQAESQLAHAGSMQTLVVGGWAPTASFLHSSRACDQLSGSQQTGVFEAREAGHPAGDDLIHTDGVVGPSSQHLLSSQFKDSLDYLSS